MEGIIYRVQDYQEHSKLLFVYTRQGKKTLVASGALKMNSHIRVLTQYLNEISFKDGQKAMFNLSDAKLINDYQNIKNDFTLLKRSAVILEVINLLIYDDALHEKIYDELKSALNNSLDTSYLTFLARMLFYLGYAPNIIGDGRKVRGMNIEVGGIVYDDDFMETDLTYMETVFFLRLLKSYQEKIEITAEIRKKLQEFLMKYYQHHLQTTLKTLK